MLNHQAGHALVAYAPQPNGSFSRLRDHFDHGSPPGFALLDREGNLLSKNQAFDALIGRFAEDFPRSLSRLEPGFAGAMARRLKKLFDTGQAGRPVLARLPGGACLRFTLEPVRGNASAPWGAACIVSEAKSPVLELVSPAPAEAPSFAHLSHDLRSPLTVAKMAAEILGEEETFGAPLRSRFLNRLSQALDRMDVMIRETLDQSRRAAGTAAPRTDIAAELRGCVKQLALIFPGRVFYEEKPEAALAVFVDRSVVWRLAENLVHNAAAHGKPGGPITITLAAEAGFVAMTVHNYGPEISAAQRAEIFAPFRRSRDSAGWGLGLAIVRRLAEENHGRVSVQSHAEAGTTFTAELPGERLG